MFQARSTQAASSSRRAITPCRGGDYDSLAISSGGMSVDVAERTTATITTKLTGTGALTKTDAGTLIARRLGNVHGRNDGGRRNITVGQRCRQRRSVERHPQQRLLHFLRPQRPWKCLARLPERARRTIIGDAIFDGGVSQGASYHGQPYSTSFYFDPRAVPYGSTATWDTSNAYWRLAFPTGPLVSWGNDRRRVFWRLLVHIGRRFRFQFFRCDLCSKYPIRRQRLCNHEPDRHRYVVSPAHKAQRLTYARAWQPSLARSSTRVVRQ